MRKTFRLNWEAKYYSIAIEFFRFSTLPLGKSEVSMGYYDFNDHFWSPQEVCAQLPKAERPQNRGFQKLTAFIVTVAQKAFSLIP
jgi:hypothetical protein